MIKLILYLLASLAIAYGLTLLFGASGSVTVEIGDLIIQPSIGTAAVTLVVLFIILLIIWSLIRRIMTAPADIARAARRASERRAVMALGEGFVALEAGDAQRARALARQAADRLPVATAAKLLEARASLELGEWNQARDTYRDMLDDPKAALAALSGLYDQARAQKRQDAALTFAQKAYSISPGLPWAANAVFSRLVQKEKWSEALEHVEKEPAHSKKERAEKDRKRTVLLTAIAADAEDSDPNLANDKAQAALRIDPEFVPAALIAARTFSARGDIRKASGLLRRVWRAKPHPHLATLYAHAQPGISPEKRLERLNELVPHPPQDSESALVVAEAAIAAGDWVAARNALAGFSSHDPSRGICLAMAEIEEGQNQDPGRAREWLARAVNADPDPTWMADGQSLDEWRAASPVTGAFDAVTWGVPQPHPPAIISHQRQTEEPIRSESDETDQAALAKPVN